MRQTQSQNHPKQWELPPGTAVVTISPGVIQVGVLPGSSVLFTGLTNPQQRWLETLSSGPFPLPTQASTDNSWGSLIQGLQRHHLLQQHPPALAGMRIRLQGLDAVGATLASLLANAGTTHLELIDKRPVDAEVEHRFRSDLWGLPRDRALSGQLKRTHPRLKVSRTTLPDLAIIICSPTPDPTVFGELTNLDVPHLGITSADSAIQVGPLVVPGKTACFNCLQETTFDDSLQWATHWIQQRPAPLSPSHRYLADAASAIAMQFLMNYLHAEEYSSLCADTSQGPGKAWHIHPFGIEELCFTPHKRCGCGSQLISDDSTHGILE